MGFQRTEGLLKRRRLVIAQHLAPEVSMSQLWAPIGFRATPQIRKHRRLPFRILPPERRGRRPDPRHIPKFEKTHAETGFDRVRRRSAPTAERAGTGYRQSGRRSTTMPSLKPATASTFGTGRTASAD